jgi:putative aldouronate transport system substrate-binding protein
MKVISRLFVTALVLVAFATAAFAADPVRITLYIPGNPQEVPDLPAVVKAAKDYSAPKVGAYIDLQVIGWGDWFDKKRLMLQSGEEADIMFTATWNDFEDEVSRNAWVPLNDLLKKTPNLVKAIGDWTKGPTFKGNIYAIPTIKESGSGYQFFFNKKFSDKYKLDIKKIKTPADLEPYLETIKKNEPGVVPYLLDQVPELPLLQRWAMQYVTEVYPLDPATNKVKYMWNVDAFWSMSKIMNKWFNKGFFQPESADGIGDQAPQKYFKSGNWAVYAHVAHPGKAGEMSNANGYTIIGTGPLTSPYFTQRDAYTGSMYAISRTSKNPEAALKLIELMNTDKVYNNLWNWGVEGKHFKFENKAGGIVSPIPKSGYNLSASWMMQNQLISYITPNEPADKWAQYTKFNAGAKPSQYIGFFPDFKPVNSQVSAVNNVMAKYEITLMRGLVDPDTIKAEVQKALKDAGVQDIENELQKQYEAFKAKK